MGELATTVPVLGSSTAMFDPAPRVQPLVARDAELARIDATLSAVERGSSASLAIVGEQGIGKTRLLSELCDRSEERRFLILQGRATEFEQELAYAPLREALDDYLEGLNPRTFEPLGAAVRAELARIFPTLDEIAPDRGGAVAAAERHRAYEAVRALANLLGARRPFVLILDDLHWADRASAELVGHLLRRPPRGPVLIAFACRAKAMPPEVAAEVETGTRSGSPLILLEPATLSARETGSLLARDELGSDAVAEIHARTGGNPFYALELARARAQEGGSATGSVSDGLRAAVTRELNAMPERARLLVEGAAVAGDPFELGLAARVSQVDEGDALNLVDALLAHEVVEPAGSPRSFAFRHPVVREAIYAGASAGWRIGAHARASAALAAAGAPVRARAHHVARSAQPGDSEAVELLARAAGEVGSRAPATAAAWLEAALALDPADHEVRLGALLTLGRTLAATGQLFDAQAHLDDARELIPDDRPVQRARLIAVCARIDRLSGRAHEAEARLLAALADLPDDAVAERLELEAEALADPTRPTDDSRGRELLEIAQVHGDPAREGAIAAALAMRAALHGAGDAAREHADRAATLLDGLGDIRLTDHLDAVCHLGTAEFALGRLSQATRHLERGIHCARASGSACFLSPMLAVLAAAHASSGRIQTAREAAEDAREAARLQGVARLRAIALAYSAWVELEAGDAHVADGYAREAERLADAAGDRAMARLARLLRGAGALRLGDPERCWALLAGVVGEGSDEPGPPAFEAFGRAAAAQALADLGRGEEAAQVQAGAERAAESAAVPLSECYARRSRAGLMLTGDDAEGAGALAASVAREAERAGSPIEAARCRLLAGRARAVEGNGEVAVAEFQRARIAFGECGADSGRDEAARELRCLGQRVPRRGGSAGANGSLGALSRREHEIAELVAEGRTNKEIAGVLYVSPKTVEKHLSRVFEKLGLSGRVQVASALGAARAGREPQT